MVATAILSIGLMGFLMAFSSIAKSIQKSKTRTLSATPLTMEKLEVLKKTPYHRLLVTTSVTAAAEPGLGGFLYDDTDHPPEEVDVGNVTFIRRVRVEKVQNVGNAFVAQSPTAADTGIKRIVAYTIWQEAGQWHMFQAASLYANPDLAALDTTLDGVIEDDSGTVVENAQVTAMQNPSFSSLSGASGGYSFQVTGGSYTLRASKRGYYPSYSPLQNVPEGSAVTVDFDGSDAPALVPIASGTLSGTVWISTYLVISQVVATSGTIWGHEQEFVELYNPTTFSWTMNSTTLELVYRQQGAGAVSAIALTYHTASLPSQAYYLIASTTPLMYNGAYIDADATYSGCASPCNTISNNADGGVGIRRSGGAYYDRVAWKKNSGPDPPTALTEGTAIGAGSGGLGEEEALVRLTSTGTYSSILGNAYDTDNNNANFFYFDPTTTIPRNSGTTQAAISGRPAHGAVVSADDGLSSSTNAVSYNLGTSEEHVRFSLVDVATGTWTVTLSAGEYTLEIGTASVAQGTDTGIPNAATEPAWPVAGYPVAHLSTTTSSGFITGTVTDVDGDPIPGIPVKSGAVAAVTDSGGEYTLVLPTGTYTVDANPSSDGGYDPDYISVSSAGIVVSLGQFTNGVDFILSEGGGISGRVTSNGTDPLPNVPVIATQGGLERGSDISGADGYFEILNLATGTYTVEPQTDLGESASPANDSATIANPSQTVFSATFTVSGAMGTFEGTVAKGGIPIETGVLVIATTGTISGSSPPTNNADFRTGSLLYYATSSKSDGTYELSVRGDAGTYNIYGWYATAGETPTITKVGTTGTVAAGATTSGKNLNF